MRHPWPGNVRELQATIDRLVLRVPDVTVGADDVRHELLGTVRDGGSNLLGRPLGDGFALPSLVAAILPATTWNARADAEGNKTLAAELIGLPSCQTLTNWMKGYDVALPDRARHR